MCKRDVPITGVIPLINFRHFVFVFIVIATISLQTGCSSSGGVSGAFGSPAASDTYRSLSTVPTPRIARAVNGTREIDPRVLADMKALAQYSGNVVYKIGTSDLLSIKVFQASELSGDVRVDERGNVTLPLIGNIRLAGMTQAQAEQRLAQMLGANLLQNPQVSVFIKEYTNQRVTVEGEVRKQGVYPLNGQVSVLQAIALAGGLTDKARVDNITLFRKQGNGSRTFYIDLDLIRNGRATDPLILNNDRIVIQKEKDQRVTVEGEVKKPGVFTFNEPTTILQTVAMAQGLTALGAPDQVILFRRDAEGESAYSVDLKAIRQGSIADPYVQGGDRIVVHRSNSRFWLEQAKTLVGPLRTLTLF